MLIHESDARRILANRRVERDVVERRSCAEILISMAMKDVDLAFEVIETSIATDEV